MSIYIEQPVKNVVTLVSLLKGLFVVAAVSVRLIVRLLMDVNEQMCYECSENMYPYLNIHNSPTRSHPSEEENRT